jgi:hypothetical protein
MLMRMLKRTCACAKTTKHPALSTNVALRQTALAGAFDAAFIQEPLYSSVVALHRGIARHTLDAA